VLQAIFPCNTWLSKDKGLRKVLTPDRDGDGVGDIDAGGPLVEHTITTYTSDIR
jgi:hypothetical protein